MYYKLLKNKECKCSNCKHKAYDALVILLGIFYICIGASIIWIAFMVNFYWGFVVLIFGGFIQYRFITDDRNRKCNMHGTYCSIAYPCICRGKDFQKRD